MNPNDKDEHVKTVYAHFGLAIYLSQVLEHGIVNAIVCVDLLPKRTVRPVARNRWIEELDSFMDRHFETTLGKMIRSLKDVISVPEDLEDLLTAALKKRNFLAHHYFRERATEFMSRQGREEMINELENAQALFVQADGKLEEVIKPVRERYGLTDEQINKSYEVLRSQIKD
jgi:hypothetical protein